MVASDKRLTVRLTAYWELLRNNDPLPLWARFDSSVIADIWQQCCVLKLDSGIFAYQHVGNDLKTIAGRDLTGVPFTSKLASITVPASVRRKDNLVGLDTVFHEHFRTSRIASVIMCLDKAVIKRAPVIEEGRCFDDAGNAIRHRGILLPFASVGEDVSYVLMGLSWKSHR